MRISGRMHIIIDGYNLIRQSAALRRFEKFSLERGRQALISSMASYNKRHLHRITVVFDGWEGGGEMEERDRQEGIEIIYSRRGEKADDVIKRLVQAISTETAVVSSDRDIAIFAGRRGATAISSPDFEAVLNRATTQHSGTGQWNGEEMEEEETTGGRKKKGPARRPSRKEKNLLAALKKL